MSGLCHIETERTREREIEEGNDGYFYMIVIDRMDG